MNDDFADDTAFRHAVDRTLRALLEQVDQIDDDALDEVRYTDGNLKVTFEDGAVFMLSQQTPTHELWLSANLQAWHFRRVDGVWTERDTREPLATVLARLFSDRLDSEVTFRI